MKSTAEADFTTFVEIRHAALFRTAYLLTGGDYHEAQDLLQTALLKVCGRWSRVSRLDNPEAYVRKTMTNQLISWRRRMSAREIVSDQLEPAQAAGPEERTVETNRIMTALARLSRQQRAVIVLRYYEDMSTLETAETLGIAPSTVKAHARAGLAALGGLLGLEPAPSTQSSALQPGEAR
jgi:RNA polymerase sigma-70 factor (sigma-E family)